MCGFAGEFLFAGATGRADPAVARCMAEAVAHRGPDDSGEFLSADGRCAIAFHRLAVVDLAGSHQPMTSSDGMRTVAFNGEIYNFRELREELVAAGSRFASAGDTEVLLHLHRRDGAELVSALEGMFAFVLYDADAGRLLLARDRLGQKPLWYAVLPDRLVFASEAPALLRHPGVGRSLDHTSICMYATMGYVPGPRSIWRGVRKLPPACRLLADVGAGPPERYWQPARQAIPAGRPERLECVRAAVTAAVESHLHADVPLGALLSGGLDSSIVVAIMAEAAGRTGGVRTFTAGFEDASYDERLAARATARRWGTEHTELVIRPAPAEVLDEVVAMYGEPFGDSSAVPTWLICRAARERVTVALVGDGGDEAFGGYDRYRAAQLSQSMSPGAYTAVRLAAAIVRPIAPRAERSRLRRLIRFADALPFPPAERYFRYRRLFGPDELGRLLTPEFAEEVDTGGPAEWFWGLYERADEGDEVALAQRHDLETYLPDDLLVKTDIASMAVGLELRAPFLDHRVVSLGLSLPAEEKVDGRGGKRILREAFADVLVDEVRRGRKRGFGVPLGRWLREELFETVRETLMDPGLHGRGILRPEAVAGLLNDHFSGRGDHSHRLWALLVFARWLAMSDPVA
ncbi:MAG TPA: asparagine synthase (glutamine-hydrolyzing) [Phycisphaerae bacterium]|nr:asparagine synthase (glutamine-hydrolyzing) [Phycisphaerae bacterium]